MRRLVTVLCLVGLAGCGKRNFNPATDVDAPEGPGFCGDGMVRPAVEECDDGNFIDDDGCSSQCLACASDGVTSLLLRDNGHCYTYEGTTLRSWYGALQACSDNGGFLATYQDLEELSAIRGALPAAARWIGLYGRMWLNEEPLAFVRWAFNEPSGGGLCVYEDTDGNWYESSCGLTARAICERAPWVIDPVSHHAYRVFFNTLTHASADLACKADGAHLVTITSEREQQLLLSMIRSHVWIGLTDFAQEGSFAWGTGEDRGFDSWIVGEPQGGLGENCVALAPEPTAGPPGWYDVPCTQMYAYVCEVSTP